MKILSLVIFLIVTSVAFAKIILVPDDFSTIQEAINRANPRDSILVEAGTYKENLIIDNKNISLISNYAINLKPEYIAATVIDGSNKKSTISLINDNTLTRIEGFTIQNGFAENGGGIFIDGAHPVLKDLFITDNQAKSKGAGIFAASSEVRIENVILSNNKTTGIGGAGGGLCIMNSKPQIINSNLRKNQAFLGGGIYCNNTSLTMMDLEITENYAESKGGGIYFINCNEPDLMRVKIKKNATNEVSGTGGGACFESTNSIIVFCDISENIAGKGAGLFVSYSKPQILNTLIYENVASSYGGAICFEHVEANIINATIVENKASQNGGIHNQRSTKLSVTNSILWNNQPNELGVDFTSDYEISYSNVNQSITGENTITQNPDFVDFSKHDFRLQPDSPCKDKGNPALKFNDIDGSRNDLGAYGGKKGNW